MQITQIQDMVGKTIKRIVEFYGSEIGILFEDGDYCAISADTNWGNAVIELYEVGDFKNCELKSLGVISEEEYEESIKTHKAEREV